MGIAVPSCVSCLIVIPETSSSLILLILQPHMYLYIYIYFFFFMTWTLLDLAQKGEEMGSLHGRLEPDVPEEISCPKARLHKASDWSSRRLEVQCFGVVRHASRADTIGATWKGTPENLLQTAFEFSCYVT